MLNAGEAKSRQEICEEALGKKMMRYDRSVDTHISRLRRKLGNDKNEMARISTIQGFGYKMNLNDKV